MDNAEKSIFDEAFLFCTQGSAHRTVVCHEMSQYFIVIGSKGKLEYLPPALVTLKSMGLGNFHAIIFEELPEGF